MKKVLVYLTIMVAAVVMNSCGSDDNDWKTAPNIAKMLCANDWRGINHFQYRQLGEWRNSNTGDVNVVMRFKRDNENATSGKGVQLEFTNGYMETVSQQSEFIWTLSGSQLHIDYKAGWNSVYTTYNNNEFNISNTNFHGLFYTNGDHRIEFNYNSSNSKEWDKFIK